MFKVIFPKNIFSLLNLFNKKKFFGYCFGWIFQDWAGILIAKKGIVMGVTARSAYGHCWAVQRQPLLLLLGLLRQWTMFSLLRTTQRRKKR
jgi:succinate-acetate transporter protein